MADIEQTIRDLEQAETIAFVNKDFPAAEALWAEDYMVNAPNNAVVRGGAVVSGLLRAGIMDYDRFDRVTEAVQIDGDLVVTMGRETVHAVGGPEAGHTIERRYTNVWRLRDGSWMMVARHANTTPEFGQSLGD